MYSANILTFCREAAKALAQRHSDGSLPLEDYNIELEDQSGQKVMFVSESDKRYWWIAYKDCYS